MINTSKPRIGTHDGSFHADDVFAVATLMLLFPEATVVRTRDDEQLRLCHVVVDVGGACDPMNEAFDHHFREGRETPRPNGVEYSSFGLVWKKYGGDLAGSAEAARMVDERLVQGIDALDNGQGSTQVMPGVEHATLTGVIGLFNGTWDIITDNDQAFMEAVEVAKLIIKRAVAHARADIASMKAATIQADREVVVMPAEFQGDATPLVTALTKHPTPKFLVFLATNGEWSVQAVPPNSGDRKFEQRVRFPAAWDWKRGADLAALTGVEDAIFSHGAGFFACAKSREGALKLAHLALTAQ